MTASMGPDWRWHFREFDERRAAAASIGHVHRAVWRDGTPVAVKVMYPGGRAAVTGTEGPYRAELARWYPELDENAHGPVDAAPVAPAAICLIRDAD
ncbi:AarF/UbiB family protein [Nocardia sp. NPDC004654]|uniref:AarF/UbiB family protein n=1 Tax=Nocardia sp. NPDC004654 TaxID=3154776 RepID=UPI0033B361CB